MVTEAKTIIVTGASQGIGAGVVRTFLDRARLHEGAPRRADGRILGFTMFGPEAGEVMAVVQAAMLAGLP